MSYDPILTHETDALDRLISQYKDRPNIEGVIKSETDQDQEFETEIQDVLLKRQIEFANGEELDRIGDLVGQNRQGFADDFYRVLLFVKIGQNVSNGEMSRVISVMKLLANDALVHGQWLGNAEIDLAVGTDLDPDLVDFIYQNIEKVVAGGVRVGQIACFDPDEPFSFAGPGPAGLGFGTTADPLVGGKFAFLHLRTTPFAFAGDDESAAGFGSVFDPIVGGRFESL